MINSTAMSIFKGEHVIIGVYNIKCFYLTCVTGHVCVVFV